MSNLKRPSLQRTAGPTTFTQETDAKGNVHAHSVVQHAFVTQAHIGLPAWCDCCINNCLQRKTDEITLKAKKGATKADAKSKPSAPTPAANSNLNNSGNKSNVKQFWLARQHFDPSVSLVPEAVEQCLVYLRCHGAAAEEGIFRLSGTMEVVELITQRFLAGEPLLLSTTKGVDVHVVAGVLKRWFRELPEPITTFELFDAFIAATELVLAKKGSAESIDVLRRALSVLPPGCSVTLRALLSLLHEVAQNSARNKMTPSNLAIVFAPSLLRANSDDPLVQMMGMQRASQFVELLIVNWSALDDSAEDDDDEDDDGDKRIADASSDDADADADADDDEDDVVHDAAEAVTIVSAPSVHQVQVSSAPVVHHAAIEHLPSIKHAVRGLSLEAPPVPKKRDKSPRPSSIAPRPPQKAPVPPRLVRMPSDRVERLREKSTALKASIETTKDGNDDKLVRKLDGKADKAVAAAPPATAATAAVSGDELTLTELELHRWESVLVVCENDSKAAAAAAATAALPSATAAPTAAAADVPAPAPPTDGNDSDSDSDSDSEDMMAPPLPPVLNATSEKSLAQAFETLVDIASVRLANRAIATRRELGAIAKSDNATMVQIAEADPYHQSFERKLAERFPTANANHVKLALRLANGNYDAAAKTLEDQGYGQPAAAAAAPPADAATATAPADASVARTTAGSEAKRPSQSRIAAREKVGAIKRGKEGKAAPPAILVRGASRSLARGADDAADASTPAPERAARPSTTASAAAKPADAELATLAQLIDAIAKSDIDLQVWVDREALANPKGGDVQTMRIEQDGAWSGLPGDVAKSVRLVETLFAKYGRNIDNFMDALYSVPELQGRDREQVFDQIGLLLTLAERNAERRMMQVQTMIRAKQHELKMQDLWIFSGDRSKRIKAALQKRRDSAQPGGAVPAAVAAERRVLDEQVPPEKHTSHRASESKE